MLPFYRMPAASAPARCDSVCAGCCMGACISGRPCLPESGVSRRLVSPECPASPGKLRSSGHPGCSEGSVHPGCPERGLYPAASVRLRPALVSWLSPHPGFPRVPVSSVYRFLVRRPSPDSRLPDRRMYRFVSIYFDAKFEKKTETAESVLRSGLKPVLNRLVYAGFGLPESI